MEIAALVALVAIGVFFFLNSRKKKKAPVVARAAPNKTTVKNQERDVFSLKKLMGGVAGGATSIDLTVGFWLDTSGSPAIFAYQGFSTTVGGGFGTVSPSALNGSNILDLFVWEQQLISPDSLYIRVDGVHSQDFWTRFYHSEIGWINSADADIFSNPGGTSTAWYFQGLVDYSLFTSEVVIFE
jgi:hypothetical protein